MAKFCANCGNQMADEDRVCGRCGTPFAGMMPTPDAGTVPSAGSVPAGDQGSAAVPGAGSAPAGDQGSAAVPGAGSAPAGDQGSAAVPGAGNVPAGNNGGTPNFGSVAGNNGGAPNFGSIPAGNNGGAPNFGGIPAGNAGAAPNAGGIPGAGAAFAGGAAAKVNSLKSGNNIVKLIIAAIVLIVACVIVGNVVGSYTGYKGTLRKFTKAIQNNDAEKLESISSFLAEEMASDTDLVEQYEYFLDNLLDDYEDRAGEVKKVSYEITDETDLSSRQIDKLKDNLSDNYDIDVDKIKKVKKVELRLKIKGKKKTITDGSMGSIYLIKEKGGWKIYFGYLDY